jgi:Ca2+-binding EF-hand superfamily protein
LKKLFAAMDLDMDDKISIDELSNYIQVSGVPIDQDLVISMFSEATSSRRIIHEAQKQDGLTFEEI